MPATIQPSSTRRFSLDEQATALSIVLRREFDAGFAFYDAESGLRVWPHEQDDPSYNGPLLDPIGAKRFAAAEHADARLQANGRFQLILVIYERGVPALLATGEVVPLGKTVAEMAQEQVRLERWAQAICDRIRVADQAAQRHRHDSSGEDQSRVAWEALLRLDHVARRLRIHKEPQRNQRRILRAAWEALGVQALAWVTADGDDSVLVEGSDCLSEWDARQLALRIAQAPALQTSGVLIANDVPASSWGARFPGVANLLALKVGDATASGWVLAVNKQAVSTTPATVVPFRRGDAAILTPFVAMLDLHARFSGRYRDLQDLLVGLARSLTAAIDAKDSYTYGHSERVARIAVLLGRRLGLQEEELSDIFLAGLLHDIGKIGIRDAVLSKQGPLTPEEFEHVKQHVLIGYAILENLRPISHLLPGVRNHHERVDGTGYPDGLAGDAIPLMARILAVADAYDAMTTSRPYRNALSVQQVEEILVQGAGKQWDARVVEAFMICRTKIHGIRQRGVGDSLRLALHDVLRAKGSSVFGQLYPHPACDLA